MSGRIWFVGAGPGAPDLLTLRAVRVLGEADVVVWARSLVDEAILEHAEPGAELIASDDKTFDDVLAIYRRAAERGPAASRACTRATRRSTARCTSSSARAARSGWTCEIVPGVSSLSRRRGRARPGADDPGRLAVADPHPPRAADVDAAERVAGRDRRPRHDDGAVPLGPPPARAAGRPDRGRLRAGHAVRGRLQGELAGRDRHPLPAGGARRRRSAPRRSPRRRSCSSARRWATRTRGRSHVYDPGYGHRYRPLGRPDRYQNRAEA